MVVGEKEKEAMIENGGKEMSVEILCRHLICWSDGLEGQGTPAKEIQNVHYLQ